MSKNNKFAPVSPPPTVPASYADLGTPTKLTTLHQTPIPGSGAAQSVFSTAPRGTRAMNDYGGFRLALHDLGIVVSNDTGRILVPWSQVMAVEFV